MNYSLGNMLSRGGALNPDGLALDLQFAADKTLTARRGPTPTFTRASTATFVGSNGLIQSSAINTPRFDHDPVTLASRGLLIEESRTNVVLQSEAFQTSWTTFESSISANSTTSPSGAITADSLIESSSTNTHSVFQSCNFVGSTIYTLSVYAKAGGRNWMSVNEASTGAVRRTFFNLSTGTIGTKDAAHTASVQQLPNGWWRVSITFIAGSSGVFSIAYALAFNDNVSSYTGNGTGNVFLWGAQIEAGAFPTSYIPTTTASVVRSADVCSITGSDFSGFYNPVEGSFATSQIFNTSTSNASAQAVFDINDTTAGNRTRILRQRGFPIYLNTVGFDLNVSVTGSTTLDQSSVSKLAGCMKANDFAVYANNVLQGTDPNATMQPSPTTFTIGDVSSGFESRASINGAISSIRYYRKRLSNEKLQSLTT